ncbi:MAG TPA: prepilin-type N-terminal cleavage/methylation domain-containing protein [Gemmatimonadales bacterium]|nr:prepilin-type N-terminal cleavage/methylation domain-containing protein [Gemmatimonadales bacterium]
MAFSLGDPVVRQESRRSGFTLIELLIVIVIIGILAAIAVPKFAATKDKAKLSAIKSDVRNLMNAQEAYYVDNLAYTTAITTFFPSAGNLVTLTANASSYTISATNASISTGYNRCDVEVGTGTLDDSKIICS